MNWDPPGVDIQQSECWAEHSLETAIPNFTVKEESQKDASLYHIQDTYIQLLSWNPGEVTRDPFSPHPNSWGPLGPCIKCPFFLSKSSGNRRYCLTLVTLKWGWKMTTYISIISILTRVDPQMPRTSHAAAVERSVAGRRNAPRRPGGGIF